MFGQVAWSLDTYPHFCSGAPLGASHGDLAVPDPAVPTVSSGTIGRPPTAVASQPQGDPIATNATTATEGGIKGARSAPKPPAGKLSLGPTLRRKPFSQSYGVGLLEAGVSGGGWFDAPSSVVEPNVGEGGAKRGEYEVRGTMYKILMVRTITYSLAEK